MKPSAFAEGFFMPNRLILSNNLKSRNMRKMNQWFVIILLFGFISCNDKVENKFVTSLPIQNTSTWKRPLSRAHSR
jgi:hypothetical protein